MLQPDQVHAFKAKGFLLGGKVLSDAQVDVLREELDRVIADHGKPGKPQPVHIANLSRNPEMAVWQVVNIWEASEAYRQLIYTPQIVEELSQLLGAKQLRVWHDQIQYKPAETGGINMWHQDSPYWPILTPKTSQTTAWLALDDAELSNGCMSMVADSYHWGNQIEFLHTLKGFDGMPSRFQDHELKVELCPVPKGHVHYHHSLTWHASHANSSGKPRRAIAIHYMSEETHYEASGNHVMKRFARVKDGKLLEGAHFPLVWANGKPVNT
jgi:phytanoyl-CoA hydroxylase